eukprot:c15356_g2_i1 orf=875-1204(-)
MIDTCEAWLNMSGISCRSCLQIILAKFEDLESEQPTTSQHPKVNCVCWGCMDWTTLPRCIYERVINNFKGKTLLFGGANGPECCKSGPDMQESFTNGLHRVAFQTNDKL